MARHVSRIARSIGLVLMTIVTVIEPCSVGSGRQDEPTYKRIHERIMAAQLFLAKQELIDMIRKDTQRP